MKFNSKDYIVICLTIMCLVIWFFEFQEIFLVLKKAYSRVSDVLYTFVTLLFLMYITQDRAKFYPILQMCIALMFSFAIVNLMFSFHITYVKLRYWEYCPYYIEEIIEQSHDNYIIDYGYPILIFIIAILLNLWWKYKRF